MRSQEEDDLLEEINDRVAILMTNIQTIKSNISGEIIPSVLSMNIDVYYKNKKKTMKLIKDAKASVVTEKKRLKQVKEREQVVERTCEEFEKAVDLKEVKDNIKKNENADLNNADAVEKMLGEFREAALMINHDNRMKNANNGEKADEESKDNRYGTSAKKKTDGIPRSLRIIDQESERYQEEKKKKIRNIPEPQAQDDNIDSRSCMQCSIF